MLSFLKNLFSKKDKKSTARADEIIKSVEAFRKRPIHRILTTAIIEATPDDKLLQVIFDNLWSKLVNDYSKEYETVTSWNRSRQAIYFIWILEGDVNNGGFNQFYFNSSGQFNKFLPDALQLVGADQYAGLIKRANNIFELENKKITEHQDGTLEGFSKSYNDNPLNKLDREFYELHEKEDLQKLRINYIRSYKKDFIDK